MQVWRDKKEAAVAVKLDAAKRDKRPVVLPISRQGVTRLVVAKAEAS